MSKNMNEAPIKITNRDLSNLDCVKPNIFVPNEVLQHLFSFMDVETLKSARQVNPLWNENVVPVLRKKCKCKLTPLYFQTCSEFITTMKKARHLPFEYFHIEIKSGCRYDKINEIFVLLGGSIESLLISFECCGKNGNYKFSISYNDLEFILYCCKKLKSLHLIAEYGANAHESCVIPDDSENLFGSILQFDLEELCSGISESDFCMAKEFLPKLVKWMPNIEELNGYFSRQQHFDQFLLQLEQCRTDGYLKLVNDLGLIALDSEKIYFAQTHLTSLIEMKLTLTNVEFIDFQFSGCSAINEQDISSEAIYSFLNESNSLKNIGLYTVSAEKQLTQVETLKFPVMKDVLTLKFNFNSAIDVMPYTDWLLLFPQLKICTIRTGYEPEFDLSFPFVRNKWSRFWFTVPDRTTRDGTMRTIEFKHNTVDYYFQKPDFFDLLFVCWFPNIKLFSAEVNVHFGLPNLLRGLCFTQVEELNIQVDCKLCKYLDTNKMFTKYKKNKYESVFQYRLLQDLSTPPFPKLRSLKISSFGCRRISMHYLYSTHVMKLLDAAPHLDTFTITSNFKDLSGQVVTTYKK